MLYMIVEHYKDGAAVYSRFRERGRMMPEGLEYLSSWIDERIERCFQLMQTEDRHLIEEWMANWNDLVEFEVYAVISSAEASQKVP
jgi:hypothetical protein